MVKKSIVAATLATALTAGVLGGGAMSLFQYNTNPSQGGTWTYGWNPGTMYAYSQYIAYDNHTASVWAPYGGGSDTASAGYNQYADAQISPINSSQAAQAIFNYSNN